MRNRSPSARGTVGNDTALSRGRPERFRGFTLLGWWRDQVTLNVTTVSSWTDLSGNARHLVQGTGSLQPLFVTSGQNGKPTLRFDGVDDTMAVAYTDTEPTTLFMIWKTITLAVSPANDFVYDGVAPSTMVCLNRTANLAILNSAGTGITRPAIAAGAFHRLHAIYNNASSEVATDGTAATGTLGGAGSAPGGLTVGSTGGGGRYHNAEYGEFIQFSKALDASSIMRLESYQRAFWGLA